MGPVGAGHMAFPLSGLVAMPAGQKYSRSNSNSAVGEIKSKAFKNLWGLPQFQNHVDSKEYDSVMALVSWGPIQQTASASYSSLDSE